MMSVSMNFTSPSFEMTRLRSTMTRYGAITLHPVVLERDDLVLGRRQPHDSVLVEVALLIDEATR